MLGLIVDRSSKRWVARIAAVFGVGWGLAGLCPGPAITSVVGGATQILVFVGCMMAGLYVVDTVLER